MEPENSLAREKSSESELSKAIGSKTESLLLELITQIPESLYQFHPAPDHACQLVIKRAAGRAAILSAGLSLPGGIGGILTLIPDLIGIWRLQAQMVADIAALHGKIAVLGREEMAWCLFRHASSQLVRDLAIQAGQRVLTMQGSRRILFFLLRKLGADVSQKITQRLILRTVPLIGAMGSGAYAWFDTKKVGQTAMEYFRNAPMKITNQ